MPYPANSYISNLHTCVATRSTIANMCSRLYAYFFHTSIMLRENETGSHRISILFWLVLISAQVKGLMLINVNGE